MGAKSSGFGVAQSRGGLARSARAWGVRRKRLWLLQSPIIEQPSTFSLHVPFRRTSADSMAGPALPNRDVVYSSGNRRCNNRTKTCSVAGSSTVFQRGMVFTTKRAESAPFPASPRRARGEERKARYAPCLCASVARRASTGLGGCLRKGRPHCWVSNPFRLLPPPL